MNWDDINFEKSYSATGAYGQSKLANVLHAKELARKLNSSQVVLRCHKFIGDQAKFFFQYMNKFPGTDVMTYKGTLSIAGLKIMPPAFKMPGHHNKLVEYAKTHPRSSFFRKSSEHRGFRYDPFSNF